MKKGFKREKDWISICFGLAIIISIVVFVIIPFIWDNLIEEMIQLRKAQDKFCKSYGYAKATDVHSDCVLNDCYSQVECDKKKVFYFNDEEYCSKWNKWGDCEEMDYVLNREGEK